MKVLFFFCFVLGLVMADLIRDMLEKLKFSEDEGQKIFCNNLMDEEERGCDEWVMGKFLSNK